MPAYNVKVVVRESKYEFTANDEEAARRLIRQCYAAWGEPSPTSLLEANAATFAEQLSKSGAYFHAEGAGSVIVKLAPAEP